MNRFDVNTGPIEREQLDDLADAVEAVIDAGTYRMYDRQADETFVGCRLCGAVDGCETECPMPGFKRWIASLPAAGKAVS